MTLMAAKHSPRERLSACAPSPPRAGAFVTCREPGRRPSSSHLARVDRGRHPAYVRHHIDLDSSQGWRAQMPVSDSPVLDAGFDWFAVEAIRDPQKYDGLIPEAGPVVYSPQYDVWATGRHAQIELMMRDWLTFSSTKPPFHEIGHPMLLLRH